jgi:peptide/nickel transport system substrate-binding protein
MEIMKRIGFLFHACNNAPAAIVALAALTAIGVVPKADASRRPQVGGTLRVQMSERIAAIDPWHWPADSVRAAAAERVDSLVFDRLVKLDEHGALQPALAISWQHDAQSRRWQFRLREGVKFSDGTPLTPPIVALALQQLLGSSFDVSATNDSVVVQADHSMSDLLGSSFNVSATAGPILVQADHSIPDLPMELATGHYFIFHLAQDNSLTGTGPFRVAESQTDSTAPKIIFAANETCWAGRPFVDKIELTTGVDYAQQANAISFGQADVVELPASQVRRAAQRDVRTASSDPMELFALVFDASRPAVNDPRLRQAISLAIDRASIADVILQRQAIVAGGLLPNWISGTAHLFPATTDISRAKDLLSASGHELSHPAPLNLFYDSSDAEARAVADRVAVNLREVGIMVKVFGQRVDEITITNLSVSPDIRLVRQRIASPDPAQALSEILNSLRETPTALETPEQALAAERAPIDAFRVIPLVHVSESVGLSAQVRDWMTTRWGGWRLDEVWLGPPSESGGNSR